MKLRLEEMVPISLLSKEVGASKSVIGRWVKAYQERGEAGLRTRKLRATGQRRIRRKKGDGMIEILHVSDLHFGKSAKQNRNATALLDGISRQFPFTGHGNRYLLVTGDITQSGKKSEYELAMQALSPFTGRVFVTPGNHDYGSLLGTDYSERKARRFDDPFAKTLGFEHPFFEKKVFVQELLGPPGHSALMIIGLNSCAKKGVSDLAQGEVGDNQLNELKQILAQYDTEVPKLLFLHHIPNRDAEYELVMTLRDWKKLMSIVRGRVDVLAFGHQGKVMEVGLRKKPELAQTRPMRVRSFAVGRKRDSKRALVLDADDSVAEQAFYLITLDGNKPIARVVSVARAWENSRGEAAGRS